MIQISALSYSINGRQILDNVNLVLEKHSFHSIIGINGVGKTLLLKLLSGLLDLQQGAITNCPAEKSYVFQDAAFFPWLTVLKNLEVCTFKKREEILNQLTEFNLQNFAEMYPHELSGGTLQKVSILRAFLNKPELILMDEPFSHLDLIQKEELYRFTHNLWSSYRPTIILVSHDLDEVIYLSEKVSYLSMKSKNLVDNYKIGFEKSNDFNQSKLSEEHKKIFFQIYNRLKEDQP